MSLSASTSRTMTSWANILPSASSRECTASTRKHLRLYEREGLLIPHRSEGNRRLYSREDLRRLKIILSLTRELGVNLAGVEIILGMRDRMRAMQQEVQEFVKHLQREVMREAAQQQDGRDMPIPVRMVSTQLARVKEAAS